MSLAPKNAAAPEAACREEHLDLIAVRGRNPGGPSPHLSQSLKNGASSSKVYGVAQPESAQLSAPQQAWPPPSAPIAIRLGATQRKARQAQPLSLHVSTTYPYPTAPRVTAVTPTRMTAAPAGGAGTAAGATAIAASTTAGAPLPLPHTTTFRSKPPAHRIVAFVTSGILLILITAVCILPSMANPGNPLEIQSRVVNAVYYPNWHVYKGKGPASMPLGQISHILYSFMGVNTDGSLKHLDEHADRAASIDGVEGGIAALNQVKCRHTHIRTLISVGGGTNSTEFAALAADPHARGRFASEIRGFVDRNNFNGVDIDWEFPQDEKQGNDYALLLEEVRRALPAPYFLLTTALPPGQWVLRNIDAGRVARTLDYMNLMCYDLTGPWSEASGNHAQLRAPSSAPSETGCADGVEYLIGRGFPAQKIVMGIPVYARTFPEARGPGGPTKGSGEIDYSELPQEYVDRAYIDDGAAAASFVDERNGFTTFDAPRSVGQKGHFAKHRGLGGLFYWTGSADREGKDSLVITGFNALHGFMGW